MSENIKCINHEIIKVPENSIAWIYIHSQNGFTQVAPHWHYDTEITYMLRGSAEYCINGRKTAVQSGEMILINDGAVHSCIMSTEEDSDAISVIFPHEFITQFQKKSGSVYFSLEESPAILPRLKQCFLKLYETMHQKGYDSFYMLDLNGLIFEMASLLFHHFISSNSQLAVCCSDRYRTRCQDITAYIDLHYAENLTLKSVADLFSISREHLSRTFKDYMGTTFKKYLTMIRMHHAYNDLVDSDRTLTEISMNNGFSDYRTFVCCFKEIYGITPLKYRKIKENTDSTFSLKNNKDLFLKTVGNEKIDESELPV